MIRGLIAAVFFAVVLGDAQTSVPGELRISIEPGSRVASIGVVRRFNDDGTLARKVDPRAKFESPFCDRQSKGASARFTGLKPGNYDVIVFLKDGTRIEGFHWPIFNEFDDPDDPAFKSPPAGDVQKLIREKIAAARYYENKVAPLAMAGNKEKVRVLMQLLRDEKTSFDKQFGAPVATLRYEVWQFTNHLGGWTRDRHSKVLHRILDARAKVRKRTWLWDRKLGGLRLTRERSSVKLEYRIPENTKSLPGLRKS
jgi:hypothetical protein